MAEQLTLDIWALILRHVPQTDRLGSCALVSQKLRQAAAAATDALELAFTGGQQQRAEAFEGFLQQHGSHLTSLKLHSEEQQLTQLPCSRLLRLEWSHSTVQLGPHNGLPGVLASCTGLTRLSLSRCQVPTGLSGLSVLVSLRDLQLFNVLAWQQQWVQWVFATLPGSVFSCMQHLTRLQLSQLYVADVHHVSCLSSLAVLSMNDNRPVRFGPDIAPGFVLPASPRDLSLSGFFDQFDEPTLELGLAVMTAAVQLTRLELCGVRIEGQGDVSSGAALLAAVSGLHKLGTLKLDNLDVVWLQSSAAYQALTASSELQSLKVFDCELPFEAWEHVFPPARICGELQCLAWNESVRVEAVSSLVRCCPRLQHLQLMVLSAAAVAALRPLTCLTSLVLCTDSEAGVPECVQGVAALTSLRSLRLVLYSSGETSVEGTTELLPLTALKQLTSCHLSYKDLYNEADPGQPPDVWQQLEQYCWDTQYS